MAQPVQNPCEHRKNPNKTRKNPTKTRTKPVNSKKNLVLVNPCVTRANTIISRANPVKTRNGKPGFLGYLATSILSAKIQKMPRISASRSLFSQLKFDSGDRTCTKLEKKTVCPCTGYVLLAEFSSMIDVQT